MAWWPGLENSGLVSAEHHQQFTSGDRLSQIWGHSVHGWLGQRGGGLVTRGEAIASPQPGSSSRRHYWVAWLTALSLAGPGLARAPLWAFVSTLGTWCLAVTLTLTT